MASNADPIEASKVHIYPTSKVEEIPGQGSLGSCHSLSAAMHSIYGWGSMERMDDEVSKQAGKGAGEEASEGPLHSSLSRLVLHSICRETSQLRHIHGGNPAAVCDGKMHEASSLQYLKGSDCKHKFCKRRSKRLCKFLGGSLGMADDEGVKAKGWKAAVEVASSEHTGSASHKVRPTRCAPDGNCCFTGALSATLRRHQRLFPHLDVCDH